MPENETADIKQEIKLVEAKTEAKKEIIEAETKQDIKVQHSISMKLVLPGGTLLIGAIIAWQDVQLGFFFLLLAGLGMGGYYIYEEKIKR